MFTRTKNSNTKLQLVLPLVVFGILAPLVATGQQAYRVVPMTVYEKKPVTVTRWVDETVTEKKQVTSYKPIWQTETRQRTQTTYKPIKETAEREEKIVLRKPIVETLLRNVTRETTTYETVTKYRDEQYTIKEPVVETQYRTEEYTVSKPVTKRLIEVKKTTTYKPVVKTETMMVPTEVPVCQVGARPDPNARPRMQMLKPGYYTDPVSGATVYRKRGLHWVQPTIQEQSVASVPVLVPQQFGKVDYVPETKEERKPIEITRYVDEVMTRKVPVEVKKMVERTMTRRVPYEVKVPTTVTTIEEVPYKRTTYKEETITRKVPYTRTVLQKVVTTEPYEIEVPSWIAKTEEMEVPKTVARKVEQTYMKDVAKTVMMKVPVDICGRPIGNPQPLYSPTISTLSETAARESSTTSRLSIGSGSTLNQSRFEERASAPGPFSTVDSAIGTSVLNKAKKIPTEADPNEIRGYRTELKFEERAPKTLDEASKSILKSNPLDDSETATPKSSFKELTPSSLRRREDGRPRVSDWRTEGSVSGYDFGDSLQRTRKTLVETSGRGLLTEPETAIEIAEPEAIAAAAEAKEAEETKPETKVIDLLESPTKPADEVEPKQSGDETAADPKPPAA